MQIAQSEHRFKYKYCSIQCAYSDSAKVPSPISDLQPNSGWKSMWSPPRMTPSGLPSSNTQQRWINGPITPVEAPSSSRVLPQQGVHVTSRQRSMITKEKHPSVFQRTISRSRYIFSRSKSCRSRLAKCLLPVRLCLKYSSSATSPKESKVHACATMLIARGGNSNSDISHCRRSTSSYEKSNSSLECFELRSSKFSNPAGQMHRGGTDDEAQKKEKTRTLEMLISETTSKESPEPVPTGSSGSLVSFRFPDDSQSVTSSNWTSYHGGDHISRRLNGMNVVTLGPFTRVY
ncbi:hypothetical protein R1flu_001930 [Riccia fluitans]|uniref:Uncharacterized protein n=1 Tax=Riccia fluitans TaxID=41844 RepID=A0ABD1Y563_9MARC